MMILADLTLSAIYDLMTAANVFEMIIKEKDGTKLTFYNEAYTGKMTEEEKLKLTAAKRQD